MIEYKFLEIKKIEEATAEMEKLTNYEGLSVICSLGKKNNVLLLARSVEYPEPIQQAPQKKGRGVQTQPFPNAIYK